MSRVNNRVLSAHLCVVPLVCTLAFVVSGCTRDASNAAPPRLNENVPFEARSSVITMPISVSLAQLEDTLNQKVPKELYKLDEDKEDCTPDVEQCLVPKLVHDGSTCGLSVFGHCKLWLPRIKKSGCVAGQLKIIDGLDCHLKGTVSRGNILVRGDQRTLSVSVPIAASVTASDLGGSGDNIHETANGSINASADVSFDVDENWNPSVVFNPTYGWDERFGVDILGIRITLGSKVEPKLNEALEQIKTTLPTHLVNLGLKEKASDAWQRTSKPVRIHENPDIWLRLTPERVGYSGYVIENGVLSFSTMLAARTETFVGPEPASAATTPLPKLERQLPPASFHFVLPVVANFDTVEATLGRALKFGQKQRLDVPGYGAVELTIRSADIYQTTGRRLAIGLDLEAKPEKWFSRIAGKVWLTTGILIDDQEHLVAANDMAIASETSNAAFDLVTALLNLPYVKNAVAGSIQYDFSAEYDRLIKDVNSRLRMPLGEGSYFVGQISDASVKQVEAEGEALRMIAEIDGTGEIVFGQLPST